MGVDEVRREAQAKFKQTVVDGFARPERLTGVEIDLKERDHFHEDTVLLKSLAEHQGLSKFLAFFGNLAIYIDNQLVDEDLAKQLFGPYYSNYFGNFVRELRDRIVQVATHPPLWVEQTRRLEQIFSDTRTSWQRWRQRKWQRLRGRAAP